MIERTDYSDGPVHKGKKAGGTTREREKRWSIILSSIGDAVIATDEFGKVTFMNATAEYLTGWTSSEAANKPVIDVFNIINEQSRQKVENPVERVIQTGLVVGLANHTLLVRKDGAIFPIDDSGAPIKSADGRITGVVLVFRDITERRQAEAKNLFLSSIVESSDDAIIGKTLEGIITSWNKGAEKVYGYTQDEVIGRPVALLSPPDRVAEVSHFLEQIKQGKRVQHYETERVKKDGSSIHVSLTISPIIYGQGIIIGASTIARDISERKKAEAEIKRRNIELEAANKELEAFSYSVSHDLRSPLRSMEGFSSALMEDYGEKLDEKGIRYLRYVQESSELMGHLIDDLLKLSRVTRSEMNFERVNLSELAENILAKLAKAEPGRKVVLKVEPDITAYGDRNLLRIVLENLLNNAWKFSGKVDSPRIEMGAKEHQGKATYFVRDNGAGLDMAYADKLFKPFQRLHKASEFAGTGIGLATVQRIVRRHGGEVWVESKVGEGATFYFTLS